MCHTSVFQHPGLEPFIDRTTNHAVTYPLVQDSSEFWVRNRIKIPLDIDFDDPATPHRHSLLPKGINGLVRRAFGSKPVRAVAKVLLVDRLQYHRDRPLQHFVLKGGYA